MSLPELQIHDPEIVTARELATHANDIEHLQADMDKLVQDMEQVKKALAKIEQMLAEDRTAAKTWHTAINIFSVLFGGALVWFLNKWIK